MRSRLLLPRATCRRGGSLLLALALLAGPAGAEEKPSALERAADEVLAASARKDEKELQALAAKTDPDPWLVVDELCSRGAHDAAEAFARAGLGKDVETLDRVDAGLLASDHSGVLRLLASLTPSGPILAERVAYGRGLALRGLRRYRESAAAFLESEQIARRIGWWKRTGLALHHAGLSAYFASDLPRAQRLWEKRLEVERSRASRGDQAIVIGNLGWLHHQRGEHARSFELQERALALKQELGLDREVVLTLRNLGALSGDVKDHARARSYFERALAIATKVHDHGRIYQLLGDIGTTYERQGDFRKGLEWQARILALARRLGDRGAEALTLDLEEARSRAT